MSLNIRAYGGFVPQMSVAFGALDGEPVSVTGTTPLPMTPRLTGVATTPLMGTTTVSATVGPFTPELGRAVWLTLAGNFSGRVALLRSTDGGTTQVPLTYADGAAKPAWSGTLNAPVAEETVAGATYYLAITLDSGSLSYRLEQ